MGERRGGGGAAQHEARQTAEDRAGVFGPRREKEALHRRATVALEERPGLPTEVEVFRQVQVAILTPQRLLEALDCR